MLTFNLEARLLAGRWHCKAELVHELRGVLAGYYSREDTIQQAHQYLHELHRALVQAREQHPDYKRCNGVATARDRIKDASLKPRMSRGRV